MKKLKVMITYGRRPPYPLHGVHLAEAFRRLGHTGVLLCPRDRPWWETLRKRLARTTRIMKYWQWDLVDYANQLLLKQVEQHRPDLIIETGSDLFTAETLRTIKQRWGTRLCCCLVEGPFRGEPPRVLQEYDRLVSTSQVAVEQLRRFGFREAAYLPFATDPTWFCPRREYAPQSLHSIGFVGAYSERRNAFLAPVSDLGLRLWGPEWDRLCTDPALRRALRARRGVFGQSLVYVYQTSKIMLNIQREHMVTRTPRGREVGTGLGWRHFDIPACGSLLLTEWVKELPETYAVGEEVETFSSPEELQEKASYFLTHETTRQAMVRRARERVLREHTYIHRAQAWLKWYDQLPARPAC